MAAGHFITICLLLFAATSCSDEESASVQDSDSLESTNTGSAINANFHGCDSIFIETYRGTACCVSGPAVAKAGDVAKYHYQINQDDPQIYWVILEGDIQIVAGDDTHTLTVAFGPNFISGKIQGRARGNMVNNLETIRCEEAVNINSQ